MNAGCLCAMPGAPTAGSATASGDNQITVSWTPGSPAGESYNVYRSIGACPGGAFELTRSGQSGSPWTDTGVSGGTTYSYKVTAQDSTGACESALSGCVSATAAGAAPLIYGVQNYTHNFGPGGWGLPQGWELFLAAYVTPAPGTEIVSVRAFNTADNVMVTLRHYDQGPAIDPNRYISRPARG